MPTSIPYKSDQPPSGARITKAAIHLGDKVYTGWRHGDIMWELAEAKLIKRACDHDLDLPVVRDENQGFVDADGNFYSRYQSARIALLNKQIPRLRDPLTSEDLWDYEGNPIKHPAHSTTTIIRKKRSFLR